MFHSGNALIRSYQFRPGAVRQHQGVITAVGRILGVESKTLILKFDKLRKRRNECEYQGIFQMGRQELADAIVQAKELVSKIRKSLEDSNPQKHFKW